MSIFEPNYYDSSDRELYDILIMVQRKYNHHLMPLEKEFLNKMYHQEEHASGLDGEE